MFARQKNGGPKRVIGEVLVVDSMKISTNNGNAMLPSPSHSAEMTCSTNPYEDNIHKRLHRAAGSKDPTILPAFLLNEANRRNPPIRGDDTSFDGRSALHLACWTGSIHNVKLLLDEMKCNINVIATRAHNYGKSPIFFAATRGREDIMNLLLDHGANILIVNNKGQSVYSIAMSHFDQSGPLLRRIKEVEVQQQDANLPLCGWVDYAKTHPDGNIYGDLDLRFLNRELTDNDVVADGVVNPTTRETRRGIFAKNNPNEYTRKTKQKKMRDVDANTTNSLEPNKTIVTDDEHAKLDKHWNNVHIALINNNSWDIFSSLLAIVEIMESGQIRSNWVLAGAVHLELLCDTTMDTDQTNRRSADSIDMTLEDAIMLCGSGDRHATLVKRLLNKARRRNDRIKETQQIFSTRQDKLLLEQLWLDASVALKNRDAKAAFITLMKLIIVLDSENLPWMDDAVINFKNVIGSESKDNDAVKADILEMCENNHSRRSLLLKKVITKAINDDPINNGKAYREASSRIIGGSMRSRTIAKKKEYALPQRYHSMVDSLRSSLTTEDTSFFPAFTTLMNTPTTSITDDEGTNYLTLPLNLITWVDSISELQNLRMQLHEVIDESNKRDDIDNCIRLDSFVSFDSEFRTDNGRTELATIQFSVLKAGKPFAWVVDLYPNPTNVDYMSMSIDTLRWLFIESDVHLLGFAYRQDISLLSSFLGEDIPLSSPKLWDLQLLAAHVMKEGNDSKQLPGLKSCCSYFFEAEEGRNTRWELSKTEQCSDWTRRPLTMDQFEYAGLDAAVLLILLAEIIAIRS